MKLFVAFVSFVACVLLLTACASTNPKVWYQPGKTELQIRQDWAESQLAAQQALLRVQPPIVATENNFVAGWATSSHRDAVKEAKKIAPLTMQARGYQLIRLSNLPTNSAYLRP